MQTQRIRVLLIIAILGILLAISFQKAQAGWVFRDQRYFAVDHICRDGAVLMAAYWTGTGDDTPDGDGTVINLGARLHSTNIPDPDTVTGYIPGTAYGPLLAAPQAYTMIYQGGTPLPADLDDNGTFEYNFYVYTVEALLWSQHLQVGDEVIITEAGDGLTSEPVEDCYLNPFNATAGADKVIDNKYLQAGFGLMPPEDIMYQVTTLPAYGDLLLNGVALLVGDMFSQQAVDDGALVYSHHGGGADNDSFNFTVLGTTLVSVGSGGEAADGSSFNPDISQDGRIVAFESSATNLIPNDTNSYYDIFLHHMDSGEIELASVNSDGVQGNDDSRSPSLSPDGFYVAFASEATNLVGGTGVSCEESKPDTNNATDIFLHSAFGWTRRSSVSSFLFGDCDEANGTSYEPSVASGAIEVAFASDATNLINSDNNNARDIYKHRLDFTREVSENASNQLGNGLSSSSAISHNGSYVAFDSIASNLVTGDSNNSRDIFVNSIANPVRVSVSSVGIQSNNPSYDPAIGGNGRYVAFDSTATNLVFNDTNNSFDVFIHDRDRDGDGLFDEPGQVGTSRVSVNRNGDEGDGTSWYAALSWNGRYVAFESNATNLVSNDTNGVYDIFIHDRQTGNTIRASIAADGTQADGNSLRVSISDDGHFITFHSMATNLVPGDTNGVSDVFVHYTGFTSTFPISVDGGVYLPFVVK